MEESIASLEKIITILEKHKNESGLSSYISKIKTTADAVKAGNLSILSAETIDVNVCIREKENNADAIQRDIITLDTSYTDENGVTQSYKNVDDYNAVREDAINKIDEYWDYAHGEYLAALNDYANAFNAAHENHPAYDALLAYLQGAVSDFKDNYILDRTYNTADINRLIAAAKTEQSKLLDGSAYAEEKASFENAETELNRLESEAKQAVDTANTFTFVRQNGSTYTPGDNPQEPNPENYSAEIWAYPLQEYSLGSDFSLNGLSVAIYNSDGQVIDYVNYPEYYFSYDVPDMSVEGEKTVELSFTYKQAVYVVSYVIWVEEYVEHYSASIYHYPQTEYKVGDAFTLSGLLVQMYGSDGNIDYIYSIDEYIYDIPDMLVAGSKKIVLKFYYKENLYSVSYTIQITEAEYKVSILNYPKTKYKIGEGFSLEGLCIQLEDKEGKCEYLDSDYEYDYNSPYMYDTGTHSVDLKFYYGDEYYTVSYIIEIEEIKEVSYTVKHLFQNIDDDEYTENTDETEILFGYEGEYTNACEKYFTGFSALNYEQKTIAEDGSTVVEIKYDRKSYEVYYYYSSADYAYYGYESVESKTVKYGAPVDLSFDYTSDVYEGFWSDDYSHIYPKDGSEVLTMKNGSIYLYSCWCYPITISYELDGGNNSEKNPSYFKKGVSELSLYEPEKDGYTFDGWYLNSEYEGSPVTSLQVPESDVILYAHWLKGDTYAQVKINYECLESDKLCLRVKNSKGEAADYSGLYYDSSYSDTIYVFKLDKDDSIKDEDIVSYSWRLDGKKLDVEGNVWTLNVDDYEAGYYNLLIVLNTKDNVYSVKYKISILK